MKDQLCKKCGENSWTTAGACKPCKRKRDKRWQQKNAKSEAERATRYRAANPEKHRAAVDRWHEANPEKRKAIRDSWAKRNPHKQKSYNSNNVKKRKTRYIQLSLEDKKRIREIYANCPDGYHVDHIIPLQGRTVCGLHVPSNLQYLTIEDNLKKGNKLLHA